MVFWIFITVRGIGRVNYFFISLHREHGIMFANRPPPGIPTFCISTVHFDETVQKLPKVDRTSTLHPAGRATGFKCLTHHNTNYLWIFSLRNTWQSDYRNPSPHLRDVAVNPFRTIRMSASPSDDDDIRFSDGETKDAKQAPDDPELHGVQRPFKKPNKKYQLVLLYFGWFVAGF